jgi:adenylyltransferase/sulfurtransferase
LLDAIGRKGQDKLLSSHVVVIGCGGLGSIAAPYLAGAGIGKLTLVDGDVPDVSNLHRQVFFETKSYSDSKAQVLGQHIQKLNPEIELHVVSKMISKDSIDQILSTSDVVLECTDNIQVKYLINDYCALNHIPMVYGAIHKYDGYISFFENQDNSSIHLRDVFSEPNDEIPSCSEVGVMGTLAGVIGLMQANEAVKYISGAGKCLRETLLTYNILDNEQLKLKLKKTYFNDLNEVYIKSDYLSKVVCASFEISLEDVMSKRDKYEIISILEDHEHDDIDVNVERNPLSTFDILKWQPNSEKPTVFYCMSGIRSGKLVNELRLKKPNYQVLSLAGGLKYFNLKKM